LADTMRVVACGGLSRRCQWLF